MWLCSGFHKVSIKIHRRTRFHFFFDAQGWDPWNPWNPLWIRHWHTRFLFWAGFSQIYFGESYGVHELNMHISLSCIEKGVNSLQYTVLLVCLHRGTIFPKESLLVYLTFGDPDLAEGNFYLLKRNLKIIFREWVFKASKQTNKERNKFIIKKS